MLVLQIVQLNQLILIKTPMQLPTYYILILTMLLTSILSITRIILPSVAKVNIISNNEHIM